MLIISRCMCVWRVVCLVLFKLVRTHFFSLLNIVFVSDRGGMLILMLNCFSLVWKFLLVISSSTWVLASVGLFVFLVRLSSISSLIECLLVLKCVLCSMCANMFRLCLTFFW